MEGTIMEKSPIGVYAISNTISIFVYEVDYTEDRVLASGNGEEPHWCPIVEDENDLGAGFKLGFMFGEMFISFLDVIRV